MISTLGGLFNLNHFDQSSRANDVIVIRHKDGSLHSTPFNVRFGRAQMWHNAGRVVQVEVNGKLTSAVMKIGKGGETYWLQPTYGAFGSSAGRQDAADKSSTTTAGEKNPSLSSKTHNSSGSGNNSSTAAGVAAALTTGNKSIEGSRHNSNSTNSAKASLSGNLDNPSLSVNAADLQQFPIHPESPLEVQVGELSSAVDTQSYEDSSVARAESKSDKRSATRAPTAAGSTAATTTTTNTTTATTKDAAASSLLAAAPSSMKDGTSNTAAEAERSERQESSTPPAPPPPGSPDSATKLPLLHRGDNGHLMVEPRAIHSAEEMQEARLALQAVAAAEKSRRRLSKLLLKEDSFFLQSAQEEGVLDAVTAAAAEAEEEERKEAAEQRDKADAAGTTGAVTAAAVDSAAAQMWDADGLQEAADATDAAAAAAAVAATQGQPTRAKDNAGAEDTGKAESNRIAAGDGEAAEAPAIDIDETAARMADASEAAGDDNDKKTTAGGEAPVPDAAAGTPEPPNAQNSRTSPQAQTSSPTRGTASAVAGAEVASSAGSRSGSTDSYKVEDTDDYFLDPIDADEYAAMYGEEELLKNVSFSSSVTSGVSLTDAGMGGSGSDLSKTSPAKNTTTAAADFVNANTSSGGNTGTAYVSPSREHDGPLQPGKAAVKADGAPARHANATPANAIPAPPPSTTSATTSPLTSKAAKADASRDDMSEMLDAEGRVVPPSAIASAAGGGPYFTRTLIPVEADLWKLDLKDGCNQVRYLARKDKGEVVSISCNIFLWNWTDRLVVSDVDGTITKSDLLGHFYAMLGKGGDWTHPGICNLYSKIARNGYHMVYLTARSVSQINQTKSYLFTLQQDGVGLPLGPVLTAPQRFFTALTQEVSKQSHVFKIACLTSVRAAFPPHTKPFFAGFGNRYNDVISYDAVSIPTHKIFIIDPSSVLHVCLVKQTYRDLGHLVDVTFPPLKKAPLYVRGPRNPQQHHMPHEHGGQPRSGHRENGKKALSPSRAVGQGAERHAYARDLLHRSSSASSSSMSSSCSEDSSSSLSYDPQDQGSATSDYSIGDASAGSNASVPPPHPQSKVGVAAAGQDAALASNVPASPPSQEHHHHHHHHHHPHRDERMVMEGQEGQPLRHASVAFSLASSFYVAANGEESGLPPAGAAGASVSPANAALTAEGGPTSQVLAASGGAASDSVNRARSGDEAAVGVLRGELSYAAKSDGDSTVYSCFSGPASPCMKTEEQGRGAGNRAATSTQQLGSNSALTATTLPGLRSPGTATSSTAATGGNAQAVYASGIAPHTSANPHTTQRSSTSASNVVLPAMAATTMNSSSGGGAQRSNATTASNTSPNAGGAAGLTNASSGPKYNYGQRGARVAGTDGVYGAGVEEYEEEVPVDPDFSSFAYWRMDPRDLIAPPVKAATKSNKTTTKPINTSDGAKTVRKDAEKTAAATTTTTQEQAATAQKSATGSEADRKSKENLKNDNSSGSRTTAEGASTSSPTTDLSHPENIRGRGLTSGNTTKDAVAAVKKATVESGGTVDGHQANADAAGGAGPHGQASPVTASAYTDLATGAEKDKSVLREKAAAVKEGESGKEVEAGDKVKSGTINSNKRNTADAVLSPSSLSAQATPNGKTSAAGHAEEKTLSAEQQQKQRKPQLAASAVEDAATPPKTNTTTRRGFFSSFGFGRGQAAAPESPNTVKARQAQEEAKKKALAHPDAWDYYRLQQQPHSSTGKGSDATSK